MQRCTFEHCDFRSSVMELDKNIEWLTFRDCKHDYYFNALLFQSTSIQNCLIDNCDISFLQGVPRQMLVSNSRIEGFTPQNRGYGRPERCTLINCDIGFITPDNGALSSRELIDAYTYADGTFTRAVDPVDPPRWAVPGAKCYFMGSDTAAAPPEFMVTAVRTDQDPADTTDTGTGNIYIDVTLDEAALPTWTDNIGSRSTWLPQNDGFIAPGEFHLQYINCSGTRGYSSGGVIRTLSPPNGRTDRHYSRVVLFGPNNYSTFDMGLIAVRRGTLKTLSINVRRAYTGAQGSMDLTPGVNSLAYYDDYELNQASTAAAFVVNCEIAGERVWSAGSWTGNETGDTLPTIPANAYLINSAWFYFGADMTADAPTERPIVVITLETEPSILDDTWFIGDPHTISPLQ
jgi:hypothetical protein